MNIKWESQKLVGWTLAIGILLVILMPFLATWQNTGWTRFSDTGEIGDTIGGVTAPIVGLLGAFLVFVSFKAQVRANEIQASQTNFNMLYQMFKDLQSSFDKATIVRTSTQHRNESGGRALDRVSKFNSSTLSIDSDGIYDYLVQLTQVAHLSIIFVNRLEAVTLTGDEKKSLAFIKQSWYENFINKGLGSLLMNEEIEWQSPTHREVLLAWHHLMVNWVSPEPGAD
jgi:type II secretory pathway pseudopilin PulG